MIIDEFHCFSLNSTLLYCSPLCLNYRVLVRLHQMPEMQTVAIDDPVVWVSLGLSRGRLFLLIHRRLPTVHIVTQWSGSGGTEAYLSCQLASFSALTLLVGSSDL